MPRMAARAASRRARRSAPAPRSRAALAALSLATALAGGLLSASPASAEVPQDPVLQPPEATRNVDVGAAGWLASPSVTAAGCGQSGCPTASGQWDAAAGPDGTGDGALVSTVTGQSGQSGLAAVRWRSPAFVAPFSPSSATFSLEMANATVWGAPFAQGITYSVRLLVAAGNQTRTIVDSAPVPPPSSTWTNVAPISVAAGAVAVATPLRLEVEVHFPLSSQAFGDALVAFQNPTLSLMPPLPAAPAPTPTPTRAPAPSGSGAPGAPRPAAPDPGPEPIATGETDGSLLARCQGEDVVIVGAAGVGRRLLVTGTSTRPPGTDVALLSDGGYDLGDAKIDATGAFTATVSEPRASQGTRRVIARLPDGGRSPAARVERRNVLQGSRRSGRSRLVLTGVLDPALAARARAIVDVELPAAEPCAPPTTVRASKVRVDRRSGRYRAVADLGAGEIEALDRAHSGTTRTRVTLSGHGLTRSVTPSQLILSSAWGKR